MIAASLSASPFAHLPERTWLFLRGLGICETLLSPEFATRNVGFNNATVSAANWQVGPDDQHCADCRILHVHGEQDEFIQAVIWPAHPERLPVFQALLWQGSHGACHASIDLATPGMCTPLRDDVSEMATALAIRHASFFPRNRSNYSTVANAGGGGLVVNLSEGCDRSERLTQAYEDYLNAWLDFAVALPDELANDARAQRELLRYKRQLEAAPPGKEVLYRLFGPHWASRICGEFLYR